jgi:hypothetical protein
VWRLKSLGEKGGINLYGFVQNNSVNFIDPDGRGPWAVAACVAMVLGSTTSTINDLDNLYNDIKELKKQREDLLRKCDSESNPNTTGEELQKCRDKIKDIDQQINRRMLRGAKDAIIGQYLMNPIIAAYCAASPFLPF